MDAKELGRPRRKSIRSAGNFHSFFLMIFILSFQQTALLSLFVVPISDHVMVLLGVDSFMCKYLNKRTFLKGMTCGLVWPICIRR